MHLYLPFLLWIYDMGNHTIQSIEINIRMGYTF